MKKRKQEVIVLDETFTLALKLLRTIKKPREGNGKGVARDESIWFIKLYN